MPVLREYRIAMPMRVDQFKIAQRYMLCKVQDDLNAKKAALKEDGGDAANADGVEYLKNEEYDFSDLPADAKCEHTGVPLGEIVGTKGTYALKHYHTGGRVPGVVKSMFPAEAFVLHEHSYTAYPHLLTIIQSGWLDFANFHIIFRSTHLDDDSGEKENPLDHDEENLGRREVVHVDIRDAHQDPASSDYDERYNLRKWHSEKGDVGPLEEGWEKKVKPVMCVYKSVEVLFNYWGLQGLVESTVAGQVESVVRAVHAAATAQMDEWYELTEEEVKAMEDKQIGAGLAPTDSTEKKEGEAEAEEGAAAAGGGGAE